MTIDFTPEERDLRWVPINPDDYEFLGRVAKAIELGQQIPGAIEID